MDMITEGKARISVRVEKIPTRDMPVFYNPMMKLNRDVSVALLASLDRRGLVVADPLAGTGIRSIRFLLEVPASVVKEVHINDGSLQATARIRENLKLNRISSKKVRVTTKDARDMLRARSFDYIDIDPFGYPGPFMQTALSSIRHNGVLAVTATDTAALTGSAPRACLRKYLATNCRPWMMHEMGLRILLGWVGRRALENGKGIVPLVSYAKDHYERAIVRVVRKKKMPIGTVWLCQRCASFGVGEAKKCPYCKKKTDIVGPLWLGKIGDASLVASIRRKLPAHEKFLAMLENDTRSSVVGFHDPHVLCKRYKIAAAPPMQKLMDGLPLAHRTHFGAHGFKSSADVKKVVSKMKALQN